MCICFFFTINLSLGIACDQFWTLTSIWLWCKRYAFAVTCESFNALSWISLLPSQENHNISAWKEFKRWRKGQKGRSPPPPQISSIEHSNPHKCYFIYWLNCATRAAVLKFIWRGEYIFKPVSHSNPVPSQTGVEL